MPYIPRAIEPLIADNFAKSKALVVTGARQVGKTTVTTHLFPDVRRINMKDRQLSALSQQDPLSFLEGLGTPLFVDEIQSAPHLIDELKVVLDDTRSKGNYLLSGSQKWKLMKGLSESLAGIASVLEMTTFSLRELNGVSFNEAFVPSLDYIAAREGHLTEYADIWDTIHRGFYPELYDDNPRDWHTYYNDYVGTYLEKDVYDIVKVKDPNAFYRFLVSCAARTGNLVNYTSIANDIDVDSQTVKSWVGVLERTGIVYLLQPYFSSHLTRAIKSPKLYFRDTGLAAYLANWTTPEQLKAGAANGAFFETFVVNEIVKSYVNRGKDYTRHIFFYRGKDKKKTAEGERVEGEIDLVIEENNTLYPVEIKKGRNVSARDAETFAVLRKEQGKRIGPGAILCTCDCKLKLRDGLFALPIEYL